MVDPPAPIVAWLGEDQEEFFDISVPGADHYILEDGSLHHNSGKSTALVAYMLRHAAENPSGLGLVGSQNPAGLHSVMLPALRKWLDEFGIGHVFGREPPWYASRFQSHVNVMSLSNGFQMVCRSMHESGSDRNLRGLEVSAIVLDEAREMTENTFDVALACLRHPSGHHGIRLATTPNGKDWLHRRIVRQGLGRLISGRTMDNTFLPEGYADMLKSQYSAGMYAQEVLGQFVDLGSGRVYAYDHDKHCRPLIPNPALPLILSLDFNVSPLCGVVAQFDPTKRSIQVLDEVVVEDDAQTRAACQHFLRKYPAWQAGYEWQGDEAGAARSTRTNKTDIDVMRECFAGIKARRIGVTKPGVVDSVNEVNALLDPAEGEPRLLVDPKADRLRRDLEELRWKESTDGRKVDKSNPQLSHAADALRYLCHAKCPIKWGKLFSLNDQLDA